MSGVDKKSQASWRLKFFKQVSVLKFISTKLCMLALNRGLDPENGVWLLNVFCQPFCYGIIISHLLCNPSARLKE